MNTEERSERPTRIVLTIWDHVRETVETDMFYASTYVAKSDNFKALYRIRHSFDHLLKNLLLHYDDDYVGGGNIAEMSKRFNGLNIVQVDQSVVDRVQMIFHDRYGDPYCMSPTEAELMLSSSAREIKKLYDLTKELNG